MNKLKLLNPTQIHSMNESNSKPILSTGHLLSYSSLLQYSLHNNLYACVQFICQPRLLCLLLLKR